MYALVTISPSDSTLTFSQFSFNYTVKLIHSVRDRIHEGLLNKSFKHVNNTESTARQQDWKPSPLLHSGKYCPNKIC